MIAAIALLVLAVVVGLLWGFRGRPGKGPYQHPKWPPPPPARPRVQSAPAMPAKRRPCPDCGTPLERTSVPGRYRCRACISAPMPSAFDYAPSYSHDSHAPSYSGHGGEFGGGGASGGWDSGGTSDSGSSGCDSGSSGGDCGGGGSGD